MVIFGKNLPIRKNSGSRQENLNMDAKLQTFLYAMTP